MEALETGKNWDVTKANRVELNVVEARWFYPAKISRYFARRFEQKWLAEGGGFGMDISITPNQVKITYKDDKPRLVENIEQVLNGSAVELIIK